LLHTPSGQARVIIRGKQHYLGPYGSEESREKYGRLIAELAVGKAPDPAHDPGAKLLVVELLARYWEFAQGYYTKDGKPSGWLRHIKLILRHVRQHYAHVAAHEIGPLAFKTIRQTLIDAGHSRRYINKLMAVVPLIYKWAAAEELVARRAMRRPMTPRRSSGRSTSAARCSSRRGLMWCRTHCDSGRTRGCSARCGRSSG
jgi:hypothetical protein